MLEKPKSKNRDILKQSDKNDMNRLRLLFFNARSVKGKLVEIQALPCQYDIVCITKNTFVILF